MAISSSSLFHFTGQKLDGIENILRNGFNIYFSDKTTFLEIGGQEVKFRNAIPMVCFCDIPISLAQKHANFYCPEGSVFGIGMTRKWAESNGLNPIIYLSPNSYLSTQLLNFKKNAQHLGTTIWWIFLSIRRHSSCEMTPIIPAQTTPLFW